MLKSMVCKRFATPALNAVHKDNSIAILPAHEGCCTVIYDEEDYNAKVRQLPDDQKRYSVFKNTLLLLSNGRLYLNGMSWKNKVV